VSVAPDPLFDIDAVRALRAPTIGLLRRDVPLVVLGSTQRAEDLDEGALRRDGVAVRRRRGGGGAVLLEPDDCWIELWLPTTARPVDSDVRTRAREVGEWWREALLGLGVTGDVHHGGVVDPAQGAVACFAGLGPGELTVRGRKLVGMSQWRARQGALVSSVLAARPPRALGRYLSDQAIPTPALAGATCLDEVLPGVAPAAVANAFVESVRGSVTSLTLSPDPFA
jgi:lipoate-protein ligase A